MRRFLTSIALAAATMGLATVATAQNYPTDQIHITVPFPAGGTTDILAREIAHQLGSELGSTVIVENRPGASGTVGSSYVVRSDTDGSSLLLTATHHVINPGLYADLPYDTQEDFAPIALVGTVPNALVVHPSLPAETVGELIELAKQDPGGLSFGSTGIGGANHLSGELFKAMAGIDMLHVPYPGAAPAMTDLLGGHILIMFDSLPTVLSHAREGNLRVLGVTTSERVASLPDVPTIDEAGVEGYEAIAWFGLYAPAGIVDEAREPLVAAMEKILASEEIHTAFERLSVFPGDLVGDSFEAFVTSEIEKWSNVIEQAEVTID